MRLFCFVFWGRTGMEKTVLLGVGGGIAAYKAASIASLLMKQGNDVQTLMTENATKFIQPLTFQSLTKLPVVMDTFNEPNSAEIAHIAMADRASLYLIAPATANIIAKLAHGIADDMVTTTFLAVTCPVVVAPAMNVHMFEHPAVVENIRILRSRGVIVIEPGSGPLACGYTGKGRLPEPEDIVAVVMSILKQSHDLARVRVCVTAGPTVEDIDPVRFLSNSSTGKMGYAIAQRAISRGANVTLISGPTQLPVVPGATMVFVRSTQDMLEAVLEHSENCDVFISSAAPADFRPKERQNRKWKKTDGVPTLELESTPDILATIGPRKKTSQVFIGFAAETNDAVAYGASKLVRKNLDMVVVNNVNEPGAGFGVDTNRVTFVKRHGESTELPLMSKEQVADEILNQVIEMRDSHMEAQGD